MKKYSLILSAAIYLFLITLFCFSQESIIAGVVEFEEKNDIGLDNAKVIIPEILINHLKNIGRYQLAERILLEKTLEEQELQLSGITNEETALKVGQLFNLDAIITGSTMKIGEEITISGRVIKTETGEIIATGTIKLTDITKLEFSLEELAYLLSGYTLKEYKRITATKEISKKRYGLYLGLPFMLNIQTNIGALQLFSSSLFYQGKYLDGEFFGVAPIINDSWWLISLLVNINPFSHIGIGLMWQIYGDHISSKKNEGVLGEESYLIRNVQTIYIGINYRVTPKLRTGFYYGLDYSGIIEYQDKENDEAIYEISAFKDFFFPTTTVMIPVEYRFTDRLSIKGVILGHGSRNSTLIQGNPYAVEETLPWGSWIFILSVGYSFSI